MNAPFKLLKGGRGPKRQVIQGNIASNLTPSQQAALDRLTILADKSHVVALASDVGMGLSTLMQVAAHKLHGDLVTTADMIEAIRTCEPENWDVILQAYLQRRLSSSALLLIDGIQLFATGFTAHMAFPHQTLVDVLLRQAEDEGKVIILGGPLPVGENTVQTLYFRADVPVVEIPRFSVADYRAIACHIMGEAKALAIDFALVFRFAPLMSGHELRVACSIASRREVISTAIFLEIVGAYIINANTKMREVEEITFDTMPGMEMIADALETHIVVPLTDLEMAEKHDLRPKRGVLLYGPPGTGKTSVGRALAHRLKGRFFLIDGSVKTEPAYAFLGTVQAIVNEAISNAPSVLFIDDADVLFDIGHIAGFGRYLLTLLDGLAGESASKVCVMMTAMDARKVPEAVLRSGRVELWLETSKPDATVRAGIIKRWMGDLLPQSDAIDYPRLADATNGFTPADLRRIAGDARAFYGADIDAGDEQVSGTDYVLRAIDSVIATRAAMAVNLADPSLRIG